MFGQQIIDCDPVLGMVTLHLFGNRLDACVEFRVRIRQSKSLFEKIRRKRSISSLKHANIKEDRAVMGNKGFGEMALVDLENEEDLMAQD